MVHLDGLAVGSVIFCHGSPRDEDEIITAVTPWQRLEPMVAGCDEDVVVCGHTHRQFDRVVGRRRVVNMGSVGMPYGARPAAYWLLIDGGIDLKATDYDIPAALEIFALTGYPVDEAFHESLIEPQDPNEVARFFEEQALKSERG